MHCFQISVVAQIFIMVFFFGSAKADTALFLNFKEDNLNSSFRSVEIKLLHSEFKRRNPDFSTQVIEFTDTSDLRNQLTTAVPGDDKIKFLIFAGHGRNFNHYSHFGDRFNQIGLLFVDNLGNFKQDNDPRSVLQPILTRLAEDVTIVFLACDFFPKEYEKAKQRFQTIKSYLSLSDSSTILGFYETFRYAQIYPNSSALQRLSPSTIYNNIASVGIALVEGSFRLFVHLTKAKPRFEEARASTINFVDRSHQLRKTLARPIGGYQSLPGEQDLARTDSKKAFYVLTNQSDGEVTSCSESTICRNSNELLIHQDLPDSSQDE